MIYKKNLTILFILILGLIFIPVEVYARYHVTCKSVILSDSTQFRRLYSQRVDARVLPASTVKIMTALLILEKLSLNDYVTVSKNATYPQPSKIYLHPGEQYRVKDLLYALLLKSANDASVALAEAAAGSEGRFVELMNERAKRLGAKNTHFINSHGLPSRRNPQYSTAYDMYLMFKEALKYDFFRQAIQKKYKTIYSRAGRKIVFRSHNKILFNDWKEKIYGKTGYTRAAQACFVGEIQKGNRTLIIGVFGCHERWDDIKYIVGRYGGIRL